MKKTEIKELVANGITKLSNALKAGKSSALVEYLNAMSRFHRYSFNNIMLIELQKPDATYVAGYRTWKSLNRFVKKGEKGIKIIAPMVRHKKDNEKGKKTNPLIGFKAVHVFDISQTDGEELPELAQSYGDPGEYHQRLESLAQSRGIDLVYEAIDDETDGKSLKGKILIRHDLSSSEKFSVLVHELAHEILHRGERSKETTKTTRETEAEAVAYVVCRAIDVETTIQSSDYIQLYSGSDSTLAESLDHIQKASSLILNGIMNEQPTAQVQEGCSLLR